MTDIYKRMLKEKDAFFQEYISSFNKNGFAEKNESSFNIMNKAAEFEFGYLKHIRKASDSINVKFYPSNWPQGYRLESHFYAYIPYKYLNDGLEIRNTYKIEIWQSTERCRVFFRFPPLFHPQVSLAEVLHKIDKPLHENIWLYNDLQLLEYTRKEQFKQIQDIIEMTKPIEIDRLYNDINILAQVNKKELEQIGHTFGSKDNHLCTSVNSDLSKKTVINISDIIRALELKYEYIELFGVSCEDYSISEGVIIFEANYKPQLPAVYRDVQKNVLSIRLCNKTKNVILINNVEEIEMTISQLFDVLGIKHNITDEIKTLLEFSTSDLNMISLLLEHVK